jgi:hypothetical protein
MVAMLYVPVPFIIVVQAKKSEGVVSVYRTFLILQKPLQARLWRHENIDPSLNSVHDERGLIRGGCCSEVIRGLGRAQWGKHWLMHRFCIVILIGKGYGTLKALLFLSWQLNGAPLFNVFHFIYVELLELTTKYVGIFISLTLI